MSRQTASALGALAAALSWTDHLAALGTLTVVLALLTVAVTALRGGADRWSGGAALVGGIAGLHLWLVASTGAGCDGFVTAALFSADGWLDRAGGSLAANCLGAGDAAALAGAGQWSALAATAGPLVLVLLALACAVLTPTTPAALLAALATVWVAVRIRADVVAPTSRTARQVLLDCARAPREALTPRLVERRGPPSALAAA